MLLGKATGKMAWESLTLLYLNQPSNRLTKYPQLDHLQKIQYEWLNLGVKSKVIDVHSDHRLLSIKPEKVINGCSLFCMYWVDILISKSVGIKKFLELNFDKFNFIHFF